MDSRRLIYLQAISVKILFFSMIFLFSSSMSAEYYFVGSCSESAHAMCTTCGKKQPVIKHRATIKKHYVMKHAKMKRQFAHRHSRNCNGCCAERGCSQYWQNHHRYQAKRDSYYVPDLSTGDDDASVYPGMQIN